MVPSFRDYQESGLGNTQYCYSPAKDLETQRALNVYPITFDQHVENLQSEVDCLKSKLHTAREDNGKLYALWIEEVGKTKCLEKKMEQQARSAARKMNTLARRILKLLEPFNDE